MSLGYGFTYNLIPCHFLICYTDTWITSYFSFEGDIMSISIGTNFLIMLFCLSYLALLIWSDQLLSVIWIFTTFFLPSWNTTSSVFLSILFCCIFSESGYHLFSNFWLQSSYFLQFILFLGEFFVPIYLHNGVIEFLLCLLNAVFSSSLSLTASLRMAN